MFWFGKKGRKKKNKQPSVVDLELRRSERKRRRYLDKAMIEMAEEDPAFKRLLIAHTFGIPLPDPTQGPQLELEAAISAAAIEYVKTDKDVAQDIAKRKIFQTLQSEGLAPSDEEIRNRPSPMHQLINSAQEVGELRKAMGIKEPGILEKVFTSELISLLIPLVSSFFKGKDSPLAPEEMKSVQINGKVTKVPVSVFRQLQEQGLVQEIDENEPPGEDIQNNSGETLPGLDTPDKTE